MAKDPKKTPNKDQVILRLQELGVEASEDEDFNALRKKLSKAKKKKKAEEADEQFSEDEEDSDESDESDESSDSEEEDKITMTQEEFQQYLERMKSLEEEVKSLKDGPSEEVEEEDKYRKVKVRLVDDGRVVTGYGRTKQYYDEDTDEYGLMLEALTGKCEHDEEEECPGDRNCDHREIHTVDYTDFMDFGDWEWAKIKDKKTSEERDKHGRVERTYLKEGEWSATKTGKMVDVEVIKENITYVLELPDGEEIELSEEAVN